MYPPLHFQPLFQWIDRYTAADTAIVKIHWCGFGDDKAFVAKGVRQYFPEFCRYTGAPFCIDSCQTFAAEHCFPLIAIISTFYHCGANYSRGQGAVKHKTLLDFMGLPWVGCGIAVEMPTLVE